MCAKMSNFVENCRTIANNCENSVKFPNLVTIFFRSEWIIQSSVLWSVYNDYSVVHGDQRTRIKGLWSVYYISDTVHTHDKIITFRSNVHQQFGSTCDSWKLAQNDSNMSVFRTSHIASRTWKQADWTELVQMRFNCLDFVTTTSFSDFTVSNVPKAAISCYFNV